MAACHAAIAKVLGIREALSWLKTCCFNNIVVEFDCIEVITALQSNTLLSPKAGTGIDVVAEWTCVDECQIPVYKSVPPDKDA
ncbi:hypothetical protein J1N35_006610 [Gossypium stocksii]|uniref:RNase H type-1 domain-containing protein n=1 Tax=Gossypium stocksii TaxID=47602 RepID=A0A9D3WHX9_9ROSI|nr:hypothetical protein J1N35_006610 [Gossypium stocksii]